LLSHKLARPKGKEKIHNKLEGHLTTIKGKHVRSLILKEKNGRSTGREKR